MMLDPILYSPTQLIQEVARAGLVMVGSEGRLVNANVTASISGGSKITQLCFQQEAYLRTLSIRLGQNDWESDEPPASSPLLPRPPSTFPNPPFA